MIVKTEDLTSTALDYAVAVALGFTQEEIVTEAGHVELNINDELVPFFPSIFWEDGGCLIEEFKLEPMWNETEWTIEATNIFITGTTCLEAISRGVVANRVGLSIDIPETLMSFSCSSIH